MTNLTTPPPVVFTPPLAYTPGVCAGCNAHGPVLTDPRMDGEGCCPSCVAGLAEAMTSAGYGERMMYPYRQY